MNYKEYNDYELIYMVRENDIVPNDLLEKKYLPLIKKIAFDYYTRFSNYGYEYDDFYQEAIIAFYNALSTYDDSKNCLFYTYLILCINRILISFTRDMSSMKRSFVNDYISLDDCQVVDEKSDIDSLISCGELELIIKNLLYELPIELSSIFELKLNGFKFKEIGCLLDIPRSTAEFRFHKALSSLKNNLKKQYE